MLENPKFKLTIVTADTGKEADIKRLCEVARTVRGIESDGDDDGEHLCFVYVGRCKRAALSH